jgi:hypothetical protein
MLLKLISILGKTFTTTGNVRLGVIEQLYCMRFFTHDELLLTAGYTAMTKVSYSGRGMSSF